MSTIVTRISRDGLFIRAAELFALRGTCPRAKVGCVIVLDGRIVSQGYNGSPPGMPHCEEIGCGGEECPHVGTMMQGECDCLNKFPNGCTRVIHAETNAIYFASWHEISILNGRMFSTHEPCLNCAKAILSAHLEGVVYREPYRVHDGLELLREAGIPAVKYEG